LIFREVLPMLLLLAGAVGVGLIVAAMVYAGSSQRARRYRPGRPFPFTPVWFLSAPEEQLPASRRRELMAGSVESGAGRDETGGASDRW
jgi:hypothetical protein